MCLGGWGWGGQLGGYTIHPITYLAILLSQNEEESVKELDELGKPVPPQCLGNLYVQEIGWQRVTSHVHHHVSETPHT